MTQPQDGPSQRAAEAALARRASLVAVVTLAILALAAFLWSLLDVLLLAFGSVLVAAILRAIADPLARRTALPESWALAAAGLLVLTAIGGAAWLFQAQIGAQLAEVFTTAARGLPRLGEWLGVPDFAEETARGLRERLMSGAALGKATTFGMAVLGGLANAVLVIFGGIYLAANPGLYRTGLVKLVPAAMRDQVAETLDLAGEALKLWLAGQLFSMVATGLLTWLALWALGLPSSFGLGLIAAFAEFIPLLGPFLGAVPALLIALSQDLTTVLWTAAAFVVIQQVESNMIQPLITRRAVSLPPALLLFSVVAFGTVFGVLGLLLAAPLTVVAFVAVKKLYVRDLLGERTKVPGEAAPP